MGVLFAGWMSGSGTITMAGALALSLGIAIQNFPEGAIISMPLRAAGMKKRKAFLYGAMSGAVEPIAAALTILASSVIVPFAVSAELCRRAPDICCGGGMIPEMSAGEHSNLGTLSFALGFTVMLALDVALG